MLKKQKLTALAIAVSAGLAASFGSISAANADTSPFVMTSLSSGYMAADIGEGKCGEGKCGGDKGEEGDSDGDKGEEGKCGEGKCGGSV